MLVHEGIPTDEFLQVRLFRSSQALRDLLYAERNLISRFDLPGILQLSEKKAACIRDLEYLRNKLSESDLAICLIHHGQQGQVNQADRSSRTLIYLHQGTLVLQIQILDLVRGTQSLINAALQRIEKTRFSLVDINEPVERFQRQDCSVDHLGLITYLESQENLLKQLGETNQSLLEVSEALHKLLSPGEKST